MDPTDYYEFRSPASRVCDLLQLVLNEFRSPVFQVCDPHRSDLNEFRSPAS